MHKLLRLTLMSLVSLIFSATTLAQTAIIMEVAEGQYVGMATTATGEQFFLKTILVKRLVKPPVNPTKTVTRVTYVFEKDQNNTPRPVALGLQKLNAGGSVVATEFEEDTVDGDGQVPDQYKIALEVARKAGLPCLVVQAGSTVVKVIKDPKTEAEVVGVVR